MGPVRCGLVVILFRTCSTQIYSGNFVDWPALRERPGFFLLLLCHVRKEVPVAGERGLWFRGVQKAEDRSSWPVADGTKFDTGSIASNSQIRS